MCGILAIVGGSEEDPNALRADIRTMGRWQFHRGPDAWGEWIHEGVALGHNRLSIIDVETGHQPMASADGRLRVVFNGEIYNHVALRALLTAKGHTFQTDHSDTETILCGYQAWGFSVFERLEGMFAIALWDSVQKRLVLARDRLGIKPLYYALSNGTLRVASEVKALVHARGFVPRLREEGLLDFFQFRAATGEDTLLHGIHKLPAAHLAVFSRDKGLEAPKRYWTPSGVPRFFRSVEEAEALVEQTLEKAVVSHLISDVPVGLFLSGGVDSSLVAALVSRHAKLQAFTVGTAGELDERSHASIVASRFGLPLQSVELEAKDFLTHFDEWLFYNDDPVADPSALALMLISAKARDAGMKVMLSGEGADELFGGYNAYQRFAFFERASHLPGAEVVGWVGSRILNDRNGDYLSQLDSLRFLGTAHGVTFEVARSLLGPTAADVMLRHSDSRLPVEIPVKDPVRRAMLFDQWVRLPDDILARTDRATMAVGLEARVPFLDRSVVEVANALPTKWCVPLVPNGGKWLLKRIASRHVPAKLIYRPKRGFDLPLHTWLRQDLAERFPRFLSERKLPLDYDFVSRVLERHRAGDNQLTSLIWYWMVLEQWYRQWILKAAKIPGPREAESTAHRQLWEDATSEPAMARPA
jgi:asparagine synthase (glutamine-hydrolysing)